MGLGVRVEGVEDMFLCTNRARAGMSTGQNTTLLLWARLPECCQTNTVAAYGVWANPFFGVLGLRPTLNPQPLKPKPLNPKPLNPKTLKP